MAVIIVSAERARAAVLAAVEHLKPGINQYKSAWTRQEEELQHVERAAMRAIGLSGERINIGLTATEFELIAPYLT